ncbi:zinc ABC transporter solute-binding protein [Puniceicoccales bacterium CK1056]|uniref:Zinc ABC transporter solute-binding protein n=1 Tax=Oceanipulchritudo coccoides TaxID=2706888 RepID=A0A6B2M508_9BACT|nr:zinc ABC transporter substrate-binding protein [Oceanipulchritudo coccoides]NDV63177.1 zinc ABC transporter solute-binding protein [Oceanipulchritudo coccoides]
MFRSFLVPILVVLVFAGNALGEVLRVGVSVIPLEPVVRELGGEWVEVKSLQQEGDSCSVFEPRPSSISWLARADLFFRTGVGYETVIMEKVRARFPGLKVIDLRGAVDTLVQQEHAHHHHGADGHACTVCGDGVESADPHIWTDPHRLSEIAALISSNLIAALPERAPELRERLKAFQARCDEIDNTLENLLKPYTGRAFYIYHPALGYFADRYGLRQIAISGNGPSPTAKELHQRVVEARAERVKVVFVQPQESRKQAEIIAKAVGAEIVEINPMAPDWEENLLEIGEALKASFAN